VYLGYIAAAAGSHSHESRPNINPDTTCNFLCKTALGAAGALRRSSEGAPRSSSTGALGHNSDRGSGLITGSPLASCRGVLSNRAADAVASHLLSARAHPMDQITKQNQSVSQLFGCCCDLYWCTLISA